jgi:O-antigen ligase
MARYRHLSVKFLGIALIAICALTLLLTGSRSGVLCLTGTALVYAWFSPRRIVYIAAMIILGIGTWIALPEQYKERYGSITSDHVDASSQGRLDAWMAGVRMFVDHPVTGVGPAAFAAAYLEREGIWLYSHSLYVELLASLGLLGVISWSTFLYLTIRRLRLMAPARGSPTPARTDNAVFARANYAILAGLLVAGVFGHILFRDTWYIIAALVVAKHRVDTLESGGD